MPVDKILGVLDAEVKATTELSLPTPRNAEIAERRAAEIRSRLAESNPLETRSIFQSAAAPGDVETVAALTAAPASAFPKIAHALDPATRANAALELRYRDDPAGRKSAEALVNLHTSLNAMTDDLRRAVGDPGQIYDAVTGKPLLP